MASNRQQPLRIAALISGGGTTLANLIAQIRAGSLPAEIVQLISSNPAAGGLQHCPADVPREVLERKSFASAEEYSQALFDLCRQRQTELVVMAGFLKFVPIPADFANRVVNIHPALIPAFCGAGFYGHRVHAAVLAYGAKTSGCTVHFVDNQYDHGPIILQRTVPVADDDTSETLAARVFAAECEAYPEAIRLFAAGRLQVEGRRVRIAN
ncbi:MAG TPA: phosphoribosylglycinamide formyltransferase [Pirellulales bacterium]|jgi:formyltetrahydrofolate-dependent phosphoribosylglycinamide formyltransferase|nr:phosphoribosylglycinamide formyltransferase [Pirellulales bacterium]